MQGTRSKPMTSDGEIADLSENGAGLWTVPTTGTEDELCVWLQKFGRQKSEETKVYSLVSTERLLLLGSVLYPTALVEVPVLDIMVTFVYFHVCQRSCFFRKLSYPLVSRQRSRLLRTFCIIHHRPSKHVDRKRVEQSHKKSLYTPRRKSNKHVPIC